MNPSDAKVGLDQSAYSVFEHPLRVYWEDTDAGGIVFYANHLKFFERARTEWLRSFGISQQAMRIAEGGMFIVAETHLKYLAPAKLDDRLIATVQRAGHSRASLTIRQQLLRDDSVCVDGKYASVRTDSSAALLCEGTIRIAWVEAQTLRPARIPHSLLKILHS